MSMPNPGFDPKEIAELKKECAAENQTFVLFDDEENMNDSHEFAHFQFIGKHEGKEVIYDAVFATLRLNYESMLYEEAEKEVKKMFPKFVSFEDRKANYKPDEESEEMLQELMEQMEEDETIQVTESLEIDHDFEYGIGLDIALNVEEIDNDVIAKFVKEFNAGTFKLDNTLYSFKSGEE